jgi:exodeoxyribonuclease V alpha subunit
VVGRPGEQTPLILDTGNRLYLYRYWRYEQELAAGLRQRAGQRGAVHDRSALRDGLTRLFAPSPPGGPDWQRIAAAVALWSRFTVISGGPGTGKTTTVVKILALLLEQAADRPLRIALAAPTGKAAARLKTAISRAKVGLATVAAVTERIPDTVVTLHRLLGVVPGSGRFRHHGGNPLPYDLVVVDEASMVALPLMAKLVAALPPDARLLLLGDRDQLASVEPGAVLGDMCGADAPVRFSGELRQFLADVSAAPLADLPGRAGEGALADSLVVLRKNYRFGDDSGIGSVSRAINAGDGPAVLAALEAAAAVVARCDTPSPAALLPALEPLVVDGYGEYLAQTEPVAALAAFDRFRLLCAMREGVYGVAGLNRAVERILAGRGLIVPDGGWYRGRPVMVTVNDYALRLFNGDTGIVWPDPEQSGTLAVYFPHEQGGVRRVSPLRLPRHETAFAMTVHKSQGSEFDRLLLVLPPADYPVLTRELLYTGLTRARQRVALWCDRELLQAVVERRVERRSGLGQALWAAGGGAGGSASAADR